MADPTGLVFDIKRFAIHDGPGVRTTVFLKGCPLRCSWCHNPESIDSRPELFYRPEKCIGCGACVVACPEDCHTMQDGAHLLDRTGCTRCGACADVCCTDALELVGKQMTVDRVIDEVLRDVPFYETSGGGITASGGEPMQQLEFLCAILKRARAAGLHTCLDTSGAASKEAFDRVLPLVDLFLWDVKNFDSVQHVEQVGAAPEPLIRNLRYVDGQGGRIVLRCPLVPGVNDTSEHLAGIAALASSLQHVEEIHVEPYHSLGRSKYSHLGRTDPLPDVSLPGDAQVEQWISQISGQCDVTVRRS